MRDTPAPWTRAVTAASAATGPSLVPAATTQTRPRGSGSGPIQAQRATSSTVAPSPYSARMAATASSASRVGERHVVRVGRAQRGQQGHHLGRCLARSVDDLGIAGPARAVGVQPRESQIGEAWITAGVRVAHAVDPSPADTLGAAARALRRGPHPQHPSQAQ